MSFGATAYITHRFSRQHLEAARHFAGFAVDAEREPNPTESHKSVHRAYVTGAVTFSVAFLETSINEFYLQAADRDQTSLKGLTLDQLALLAELWSSIERKSSVLDKFKIALVACGAVPFQTGQDPFQSVDALIGIRNALIHYRPEPSNDLQIHRKIEERVNGRFALNPFCGVGSLWFPHRCLGSGW